MNIDPIHSTQEIPQVPSAGAMVGSARRADRTLFAVVGVAATALLVGAFAVIGTGGTSVAGPAVSNAPLVADEFQPTEPDQAVVAPVDLETGGPAGESPAVQPQVAEPADEPEAEPVAPEAAAEPETDAGDPPAGEPEVNPCMVAADAGQRFFAQDDLILDEGELGGSIHLTACDSEPIALEFDTVPGVLLSASEMDLQPAGGELFFIIDEAAFEDQDVEFKIKITEVDCCAHYVDVSAKKTFGLGVLLEFDPGVFFMLEDTGGIDPDDEQAIVDQFVAEYGWHPSELDNPMVVGHEEAISEFIEQYGFHSPTFDEG